MLENIPIIVIFFSKRTRFFSRQIVRNIDLLTIFLEIKKKVLLISNIQIFCKNVM